MEKLAKLAIVIPAYNEEEILNITSLEMQKILDLLISKNKISNESCIYFVDDGSKDKTWQLIEEQNVKNSVIKGIKLSRNFGHQGALLAGLLEIDADVLISIDADLQDDTAVIEDMIDEYINGSEVVYGVRKERTVDTAFKKHSAEGFYRLMELMGVELVFNHADYRLLTKRAIEKLKEFNEVNLFLRGIVPLLGFRSSKVYYDRKERIAGESKYPLKKMLSFAFEGITSFSVKPLRMITIIGVVVFIISLIISFWALCVKLFSDSAVPGWASTVLPIYFIGGIQLLSLGIIGEYIGKIYKEVKNRPRYIIEKIL